MPATHARHVSFEEAPNAAEYVPDGQSTQWFARSEPTVGLNLPAEHKMHVALELAPDVSE